jgi:hypothetical protein
MQTGFTVVEPAIAYDWSASVTGPDYSFDYESSGGLFSTAPSASAAGLSMRNTSPCRRLPA